MRVLSTVLKRKITTFGELDAGDTFDAPNGLGPYIKVSRFENGNRYFDAVHLETGERRSCFISEEITPRPDLYVASTLNDD